MVVGPRYIPGAPSPRPQPAGTGWTPIPTTAPDASRITPPVAHPADGKINPVTLRSRSMPACRWPRSTSSSHAIHTQTLSGDRYEIELAEVSVPADRDFELTWTPVIGAARPRRCSPRQRGDEVVRAADGDAAGGAARRGRAPAARGDLRARPLGLDGRRVHRAGAGRRCSWRWPGLRPVDRFNVIRFNHRTDALFPRAQAADRASLAAAQRYVGAIRADGGTEMLPALQLALDGAEHADRLRQVIFLTDGAVGNEERLFQTIRERLGGSRLFTIGIGSAPNSHFMREAARLGRGTFTYIGSPAEVKEKMSALFRKLESPVLADVRLELPGAADAEIVPGPIPDLYVGEPILVAVRARRAARRGGRARTVRRRRPGRPACRCTRLLRAPACRDTGHGPRSPCCSTAGGLARSTTTCAMRCSTWRCTTIWSAPTRASSPWTSRRRGPADAGLDDPRAADEPAGRLGVRRRGRTGAGRHAGPRCIWPSGWPRCCWRPRSPWPAGGSLRSCR